MAEEREDVLTNLGIALATMRSFEDPFVARGRAVLALLPEEQRRKFVDWVHADNEAFRLYCGSPAEAIRKFGGIL